MTTLDHAGLRRRARAKREVQTRASEFDLGQFIELTSPGFYRPDHLGPVVEAIDRSMREPVFAVFSTPPRHFKSETLFHHCARLIKFKPKTRIAYATYSGDFALRKSRRIRSLAADAGVWVNREKTFRDRSDPANSVKFWQTSEGGGLIAGGRGGAFVGEGFDLVVIDDPFKNREEAESPLIRDKVWETIRMLLTRLEPGASVFVSMQRWHEDDVVGRIVEMSKDPDSPPWEVINLPAIDREGTPLCAERYDAAALRSIRATQGEYNWSSQYMGNPRPPGDRVFAAWARFERFELKEERGDQVYDKVIAIGVDAAGTAKTKADNTSITVAAGWKEPEVVREDGKRVTRLALHMDIIRNVTMKREVTDVTDVLYDLQRHEFPGSPIVIETQGGEGKAVAAMLKRVDSRLNIVCVTTTADKLTRNLPYAAAQTSRRVRIPVTDAGEALWIEDFTAEHKKFTGRGDKSDDRVDSSGHVYNYFDGAISGSLSKRKGRRRGMVDSPF